MTLTEPLHSPFWIWLKTGCVGEYFKDDKTKLGNEEDPSKRMQGCKCALNSKATEEVMANIARGEPAHGRFNFRHP
ncbi:aluminum-activated malate transporter 10 [Quercus suber]|uniref:Aluminum-activated malate transporter 10 n=1 Tax=Quercus suber TaxID=58331 RepID=A0AAW0K3V0_QUESU